MAQTAHYTDFRSIPFLDIGKNKNTRTVQAESSKFASLSFD